MFRRTGFVAVAVLTAALAGCGADGPPTPTAVRQINPDRASPKELREHVSLSGVLAGAEAGKQMLVVKQVQTAPVPPMVVVPPAPPVPPVVVQNGNVVVSVGRTQNVTTVVERKPDAPRPPPIRFTTKSDKPEKAEAMAVNRATELARVELMKHLQMLDPPVMAAPSMVSMRSEFVKAKRPVQPSEADREAWKAAGLSADRVYAEVDVEVSESQLQKLRAGQRVDGALRVAAVLFAVLLAAHGFFRLDAWTKGYLTGWLGVGAAVVVVAALLLVLS